MKSTNYELYTLLDFLEEVGYGVIGKGVFMIYSGLVKPDSIYELENYEDFNDIVFFGDDFTGDCFGFNMSNNWQIVKVNSSGTSIKKTKMFFEEFIAYLDKSLE